jgi:threonine aldolase
MSARQTNYNSDNCSGACPEVIAALLECNDGMAGSYGIDSYTAQAAELLQELFETCKLHSFPVATGTAANAMATACTTASYQSLYCTRAAHLFEDECGAPELFSGGCKVIPVDELGGDESGKMDPAALRELLSHVRPIVHESQPAAVSITQPTEYGTVYGVEQIQQIAAVAKEHGMLMHMDGARFGNALVHLGCSAAEMTWKAGVDVLSFGATKNGAMCAESLVFFEATKTAAEALPRSQGGGEYSGGTSWSHAEVPWAATSGQAAARAPIHRKRTGHLFSKMRFISAQLVGYLDQQVWRRNATNANAMAAAIATGLGLLPGFSILYPTQINMREYESTCCRPLSELTLVVCGSSRGDAVMCAGRPANRRVWPGSPANSPG